MRIARDISDAIRVMQTLKFFGVRVIYISQDLDSANEQAETLVAVHGMIDSLYLREMAKKGGRSPTAPPVAAGFRVDIVPEEAEIIRYIFESYANGIGAVSGAGHLGSTNIRPTARHTTEGGARPASRPVEGCQTHVRSGSPAS